MNSILYRLLKRIELYSNNVLVNKVLILLKLDSRIDFTAKQWKEYKYNKKITPQSNSGFSHKPEEEEALRRVKNKLIFFIESHIKAGDRILDFGCGPGIYMQLLNKKYEVEGVDVSKEMLDAASSALPSNKFHFGNFLKIKFVQNYQAIYSISVLQYIPVSQIESFFAKCAELLNEKGIIFIQYPAAKKKLDLFYPDRHYIQYSPDKIDRIAGKYFNIIYHKQSFDERGIVKFDKTPYSNSSMKFKDGFILVAERKPH